MNFSFGITTDFSDENRVQKIIQSIRNLNIPNYEILIISETKRTDEQDIKNIFFDDKRINNWVTKKKNILCEESKYDNVVLLHDYYVFDKEWYSNFLSFGEEWDVCSNAQLLITGKRHFTDWVCWDSPFFPRYTSLNYDDWSHTKYMYQSGGFMLLKKWVMKKFPMDESVGWGTGEDVEWSLRMRDHVLWKCNGKSIVKHNKWHRDALQ